MNQTEWWTVRRSDNDVEPTKLAGLEVDNLLSILALLGLLRALERAEPTWHPRASWHGPPWHAHLHVDAGVDEAAIADAALRGTIAIVETLASDAPQAEDGHARADVNFSPNEFHAFAQQARPRPEVGEFATCLMSEAPLKNLGKDGGSLHVGPLVLLFGQGHQHFLNRFFSVPRGDLPNRLKKQRTPPDLASAKTIAQALFEPWSRTDDADGFRWDPEDDQRYALQYGDPSASGAAPTVHGANRLAAIGFLSFPSMPSLHRPLTRGVRRNAAGLAYVWPIWTVPMDRVGIESLLSHPALVDGKLQVLKPFGVSEIYRAKRVANGKFMNVTRAMPVPEPLEW